MGTSFARTASDLSVRDYLEALSDYCSSSDADSPFTSPSQASSEQPSIWSCSDADSSCEDEPPLDEEVEQSSESIAPQRQGDYPDAYAPVVAQVALLDALLVTWHSQSYQCAVKADFNEHLCHASLLLLNARFRAISSGMLLRQAGVLHRQGLQQQAKGVVHKADEPFVSKIATKEEQRLLRQEYVKVRTAYFEAQTKAADCAEAKLTRKQLQSIRNNRRRGVASSEQDEPTANSERDELGCSETQCNRPRGWSNLMTALRATCSIRSRPAAVDCPEPVWTQLVGEMLRMGREWQCDLKYAARLLGAVQIKYSYVIARIPRWLRDQLPASRPNGKINVDLYKLKLWLLDNDTLEHTTGYREALKVVFTSSKSW